MKAQDRENSPYTTLKSSFEMGWSALLAELRSYRRSEGSDAHPVASQAKIAVVLGGSKGIATYKIGGHRRSARTTPGLMWLKPTGGKYDEFCIASSKVQVFDLYLSTAIFAQLSHDYNLPTEPDRSIRYEGGVQDEVINQIGR